MLLSMLGISLDTASCRKFNHNTRTRMSLEVDCRGTDDESRARAEAFGSSILRSLEIIHCPRLNSHKQNVK